MKIIKENIKNDKLELIIGISFFDVKNKLDYIKNKILNTNEIEKRDINWIDFKDLIYEFIVRSEINNTLKTIEIKNNIACISNLEIKKYLIIQGVFLVYYIKAFISDFQLPDIEYFIKKLKSLNKNFTGQEILDELIKSIKYNGFSEDSIRQEIKNILNEIRANESNKNKTSEYLKYKENLEKFFSELRHEAIRRIKFRLLLEKVALKNKILLDDEDKIKVLIDCIRTEETNIDNYRVSIDAIFKTLDSETHRRSLRFILEY